MSKRSVTIGRIVLRINQTATLSYSRQANERGAWARTSGGPPPALVDHPGRGRAIPDRDRIDSAQLCRTTLSLSRVAYAAHRERMLRET